MLTHNNPEFLKELFKFFPDKEAGIRECYFQFMKGVAQAEGLTVDQSPSLETFISKQGLQNFLQVTQRMVKGATKEMALNSASITTTHTDPLGALAHPNGARSEILRENGITGSVNLNQQITATQQIETLPEIQIFLDKIKEEVICNDLAFMNFVKSYQARAQTNLNFKTSMARLEQQTIKKESELEKRLSQQGIDTSKLEAFNGLMKPTTDALAIEGSGQKQRFNGQGYKEPGAKCDPSAQYSHIKDIEGKSSLGFKNSCWIILTGQKPTSGLESNSKNEKTKGHHQDSSYLNASTKDQSSANYSSVAQMKGYGSLPTGSAPAKSDGRGTGVRASTAEREPGSTNINFLQQKQMVTIQLPQKRYGHSSTIIDNKMYIFGGAYRKGNGASNFHSFHECQLKLDSQKEDLFKWRRIQGEAPKTRDSHSCIGFLDQLLIFGGSCNSKSYNDLYKFSITNKIWTKLECIYDAGHQPSAREGHIAVLVDGDKMLIHGGINENQDCFDDAFILVGLHQEIDQCQSEIKFDENGGISNINQLKNRRGRFEMLRWFKCVASGDIPSARDSHSVTICNNQIYLFGGQDYDENLLNDFYRVTLTEGKIKTTNTLTREVSIDRTFKLSYKRIQVNSSSIPIKRSSHSMNLYMNRWLVLIGGETSIDTPPKSKSNNAELDDVPFNKSIEDASEMPGSSQEESNNKALGDVWLYDTILNTWNEINPQVKVQSSFNSKKMRKSFEPRMAHSADVFGNYIIIFGGYSSATNTYSPNNFCLLSLSGCTDYMLQKPLTIKQLRESEKLASAAAAAAAQTSSSTNLKIQIDNPNQNSKVEKLLHPAQIQKSKSNTIQPQSTTQNIIQAIDRTAKQKPIILKHQNIQTLENENEFVKIQKNIHSQTNRLDFQFIYKLAQQIKNPIQLIVDLLKCQINQYSNQFLQKERFEQNRQIINLEEFDELDLSIQLCNHEQQDINILFIKDNGPGMSHSDLKEALTGQSFKPEIDKQVESQNFSIYKYASLKLASQTLVISRTQQVSTKLSLTNKFKEEVHIGMLSTKFIKDSNSSNLIAPIVSFEVIKNPNYNENIPEEQQQENKYKLLEKTPLSDKFLNLILGYIGIFTSIEELKQHILQNSYPKNQSKFQTGSEIYLCELQQNYNSYETDIFLINDKFKKDKYDLNLQTQTTSQIEDLLNENVSNSLVTLIKYSYIDFPNNINLTVNDHLVQKENPFSQIIQYVDEDENLAIKGQSENELYRYWVISSTNLNSIFGLNGHNDDKSQNYEGLMIYHGNDFIMKDELAQPINQLKNMNINKRFHSQTCDSLYGLIMILQDDIELTYDKQDFVNSQLINQIRDDICRTYFERKEEELQNEIEHVQPQSKKQKIDNLCPGQYNEIMNHYNHIPNQFVNQVQAMDLPSITHQEFENLTPQQRQLYMTQMCALPRPIAFQYPAEFYQNQQQEDPEEDEFDKIEEGMNKNVNMNKIEEVKREQQLLRQQMTNQQNKQFGMNGNKQGQGHHYHQQNHQDHSKFNN